MELQSDKPQAGHLEIRLPSMAAQRLPDVGNGWWWLCNLILLMCFCSGKKSSLPF